MFKKKWLLKAAPILVVLTFLLAVLAFLGVAAPPSEADSSVGPAKGDILCTGKLSDSALSIVISKESNDKHNIWCKDLKVIPKLSDGTIIKGNIEFTGQGRCGDDDTQHYCYGPGSPNSVYGTDHCKSYYVEVHSLTVWDFLGNHPCIGSDHLPQDGDLVCTLDNKTDNWIVLSSKTGTGCADTTVVLNDMEISLTWEGTCGRNEATNPKCYNKSAPKSLPNRTCAMYSEDKITIQEPDDNPCIGKPLDPSDMIQ